MSKPFAISDALEYLRRSVALCRQQADEVTKSVRVPPIRRVGIVGAGIMGTAIARAYAARGLPVVLFDSDENALRRAAAAGSGKGISLTQAPDDLGACDLVIESIAEKRPAKQALYKELSPRLRPEAILATNTSTIPITRLAAGLDRPERFCGLHFCHPVALRPAVEVIAGTGTEIATVAAVLAQARYLGKLPLLVPDGPGFIINRLLMSYVTAALGLLVEGVSPTAIDAAMTGCGFTLGPLALLDEIGLDTALQSGMIMSEVRGERTAAVQLLVSLVKGGQLGVKTRAGIYAYPGRCASPHIEEVLQRIVGSACNQRAMQPAEVRHELLRPMAAEGRRLVDEKMAEFPWQVDLATVFGLGFPSCTGGLLHWSQGRFEASDQGG